MSYPNFSPFPIDPPISSDTFDPNAKIAGVNIFFREIDAAVSIYCDKHHITEEQFDEVPAFLRLGKEGLNK